MGWNDGNAADGLRFFMTRGNKKESTKVLRLTDGRANVTAKLASISYLHPDVPGGGEIKFLVKTKGPGKRTFKIRVTSETIAESDVMKAKVSKP